MRPLAPASSPGDLNAGGNLRGIVAMCTAMAAFITNDMFIKLAGETLPTGQAIFLRGVVTTTIILALAIWTGALRAFPKAGRAPVAIRSLADIVATLLYLTALLHIPIANATAIIQAMPIIMTLSAALFLGEQVRWRRWLAVSVGFAGMLMIVRPGAAGFDVYAVLAVIALGFIAVRDTATRFLPPDVPSLLVILVGSIAVTLGGAGLGLVETWRSPDAASLVYVLCSGTILTAGYFFIVDAMRHGEVSVVSPFRYIIILFAIVYGYTIWGELPDVPAMLGIVLIMASGLYVFYREARLQRSARAASTRAREPYP